MGGNEEMTIDDLWEAVCSDDRSIVRNYYKNGGTKNLRYPKFGHEHSLIMGAFRNENYDMYKLLISYGETITSSEESELDIPKLKLVKKLGLI